MEIRFYLAGFGVLLSYSGTFLSSEYVPESYLQSAIVGKFLSSTVFFIDYEFVSPKNSCISNSLSIISYISN